MIKLPFFFSTKNYNNTGTFVFQDTVFDQSKTHWSNTKNIGSIADSTKKEPQRGKLLLFKRVHIGILNNSKRMVLDSFEQQRHVNIAIM